MRRQPNIIPIVMVSAGLMVYCALTLGWLAFIPPVGALAFGWWIER